MNAAESSKIVQNSDKEISLTILQRISKSDKAAVENCIDAYGNLVWAMAKKFTASPEEAENAAQEIFIEVWKHACHCDPSKTDETDFIASIAYRYLLKRALNQSLQT